MDQNQTVDNDLQKAIDDITNTTSVDPVFSDPVAAPSSVPEGDTGELGESVGPFPEPKVEMTAPEPAVTPIPEISIPDLAPAPAPAAPITPTLEAPAAPGLSMHQVKEAALRDLVPLLDRLNLDPSQRFKLYREIFENLRDYTVLELAYKSAKEIPDEGKRAEALLYLVESIDKM